MLVSAGVAASLIGSSCVGDEEEAAEVEAAEIEAAGGLVAEEELAAPLYHASGVLTLEGGETYRWTRRAGPDGELEDRYFDADAREVPEAQIERRIAASQQARWDARGAMNAELFATWRRMGEGERARVWGWMRLSTPPARGEPEAERALAEAARAAFERVRGRLSATGGSAVHVDGPFVQLELSRDEIADLAWSGEFIQLDPEWVDRGPASSGAWYQTIGDDLNVAAGWDGSGRRVAIVEPGGPTSASQLGTITAQATPAGAPGYYTDTHMQQVAGMVADNVPGETQDGTAPAVGLLLANWAGFTGPEVDLRLWAANRSADAINISRVGVAWDATPSVNDIYNDWLSLRPPFPLVVLIAGNDGADPNAARQFVHHRGYNTITVGASDDRGTTARSLDTIAPFSSWKNSTTPFGDRELPEIVAPGVNVCGGGLCGNGTSFAAPIVAGTVAQLRERNGNLQTYPEAAKAMLMASADCNVSQVVLNLADAYDDKDGVGNLNSRRAVQLAASPFAPATHSTSGHAYGQLFFNSPDQWSGSEYVANVFRARTDAGGRMTVVLTWNSTPVCTDQTSSASCSGWGPDTDLNLYLRSVSTGSYTRISASRDNNYEYIILNGHPNKDYYIEIRKSGTPRNPSTYFGLAWTQTPAACPNPT